MVARNAQARSCPPDFFFHSVSRHPQVSSAMAPATCDACGKSGKLLRCGRCCNAWFCNRECQVAAARQGHSGANCRPADGPPAPKVADAEVTSRVTDAAGPSTTAPGVDSASLAPAAVSCHACGKSDGKLLLCGRCRNVWFCSRECQAVARKDLGHRGANCRPADGAQTPISSANARSPFAAPSRPSTPIGVKQLAARYNNLFDEGQKAAMANTRVGYLAAVAKAKEAAAVSDFIGGEIGAACHSDADRLLSSCLLHLGEMAAAACAACSSLRTARASGNISALVSALSTCGNVARKAPNGMAKAERENREQERLSGTTPSYGGLDLSQEGRISLPTSPAALSRLRITYMEAAVALCDSALVAAGGRDSPAADDDGRVPMLRLEAEARGSLGVSLDELGVGPQRSLELRRQAVALLRREMQAVASSDHAQYAERSLAVCLCNLGVRLSSSDEMAEAAACMREALELSEETDDVGLKQMVLINLANMSGRPDLPVRPAEAVVLRSRLNALYAQTGRSTDTSCTICLELLEMPSGDAEYGAADDSGRDADGYINSAVRVLECGHQFHRGCLSTWWRTRSESRCPLCKM